MIVVAGTVGMKPENREDALRAALRVTEPTRREPGCRSYTFYTGASDPNTLHVFEEWDSEQALAAHFETMHVKEFFAALSDAVTGPPQLRKYTVSAVEEL